MSKNTPPMTDDRCPDCGGLYALIGYRHLCRGADVTKLPVTELPVTKTTVTKLKDNVTKFTGRGRRPIGDAAMTVAERQRRRRAALKALRTVK